MYYCLCIAHNYSYEIYEILSLFFPGEKLTVCECDESIPADCMLIVSTLEDERDLLHAEASLYNVSGHVRHLICREKVKYTADDNIKKSSKHAVKLSLFKLFKGFTNAQTPWGILVGIRPTKIVNDLKSKNVRHSDIEDIMKNRYLLRDDKIKLVMDVSDNSYSIINNDSKRVSIYIGIPFCPTKCLYCSFTSYPLSGCGENVKKYMDSLKYEMLNIGRFICEDYNIDTIYVGGGTPTSLPDGDFDEFLECISKSFDIKSSSEFTVEAGRPDTINGFKLQSMKNHGVSRISINPQTMNNDTLRRIGRNHTVEDIITKYNMARQYGFDNINMDIILGLPGENTYDVRNTLDQILRLSPENITVHTMAVKRASSLREKLIENVQIPIPEGSVVNDMMEYVQLTLADNGYIPYYMYRQKMMVGNLENIGYCKPGYECIYNIQMIEEKETIIGLGADSVTKLVYSDENRIERLANKKDIDEYIKTIKTSVEKKINALT